MATSGPTLNDLRQALARKEFRPVYFFHGEEDLLVEEAADLVIGAALSPDERGFNLDIMYGTESDARDIVAHASSFPMMAERRVVVVRGVEKIPNGELLAGYLEHPSETTCLVLQTGKVDARKKPFPAIKRAAMTIEFRPLSESQIQGWIVAHVAAQKQSIEPDAARMLSVYVGPSLREIRSELEKLFLYAGDRKAIRLDDVQAVVGASREFNIFELQKAIGARTGDRALLILNRMIESGEPPVKIVFMLTRFFAVLWHVLELKARGFSSDKIGSELGLASFQLRDFTDAAHQHGIRDVEQAILALAAADEQLKTSAADSTTVMEVLIVQLTDRTAVITPVPLPA